MQSTVSIEQLSSDKDSSSRLYPLGPGAVLAFLEGQVAAAQLGRLLVRARLVGPVAAVEVSQVFHNHLNQVLEGYYLFPLPSNATLSRFRFQIGTRGGEMQVVAKEQVPHLTRVQLPGFLSALLSGEFQPVYCVPLGPIQPQETVQIEIVYAEALACLGGDFRYHFPLLTSGRFQSGASLDSVSDSPLSLAPGLSIGNNLSLNVVLEAGGSPPLRMASSHPLQAQPTPAGEISLDLVPQDLPHRDFHLAFRFGHDKNPLGFLRQGRQHFLYHLHPPQQSPAATLPRHLILLLDISENASSSRLEVSRAVAGQLLNSIGPGENFSLVGFNNQLKGYETGIACDQSHIGAAQAWLGDLKASGRPDMSIILERILQLPQEPGKSMVVVLLACGKVGNEPELYSTLTNYQPSIRFNCVGIDQAVNAAFLRRLAGYTRGQSVFIGDKIPDPQLMAKITADTRGPLLQDFQLVDQGLGINSETFTPGTLPGLTACDSLTVMGLRAGNGGLEVRARTFSGHPWAEAAGPLPSQNPAIGVVWAHLKAREMSDELKLIGGPRASRLRDLSATLARDYRLTCDSTACLLAEASGHTWLPSLLPQEWNPEPSPDLTRNPRRPAPGAGQDLPSMEEPARIAPGTVESSSTSETPPSGLTMKAVLKDKVKQKGRLHSGNKNEPSKPVLGSGKLQIVDKLSSTGKPVLRPGASGKMQVQTLEDDTSKRLPPPKKGQDDPPATEVPPPPPPEVVAKPEVPPVQDPEAQAREYLNSNPEFRQATMADLKLVYQSLAKSAQAGGTPDPQLLPLLEKVLRRLQPLQDNAASLKEAYRIGVLSYQALRGQDPQATLKTQHWVQRFAKLF